MMKNSNFYKNSSRILAMILAGAMTVSLGADVTTATNVYAAESTETAGSSDSSNNSESGSSQTVTYYCGKTAHTHTDDCYETKEVEEKVLTCGQEESESTEGHQHTEDCYTTTSEKVLTCKDESEDHEHTDDCYEVKETEKLTCGQEEAEGTEGHQHTEDCYETKTVTKTTDTLICDKEEHTHTDACKTESGSQKKTTSKTPAKAPTKAPQANGTSVDQTTGVEYNGNTYYSIRGGILTGISGSGTKYDAEKDVYDTNLKINFEFTTANVKTDGLHYYLDYPDGVIIPDSLLGGSRNLYDQANKKAGTYHFEKVDGTDTYRVYIDLLDSYVNDSATGDTITGYIQFEGTIGWEKGDKTGKIEIKGSDGVDLVIPRDEITYPDGETNYYDISVKKSGEYSPQNGKITYTVLVSSLKGTPSTISYSDVITATGMTLGSPSSVTVTKQTMAWYNENYQAQMTDGNGQNIEESVSVNPTITDNKIEMTLDQLPKGEKTTDSGGTACTKYYQYKIVYTYDVSDITSETPAANNTVNVSSKDGDIEVKGNDTCNISITNKHTLSKSGWYDGSNNTVLWTITVNTNKIDITGATLSDEMLAKIKAGTDLEISPNKGYELTKDSDGNITSIKFVATDNGKNLNSYTIRYRTDAGDKTFSDKTITNDATFKPKDGESISDQGKVTISGGAPAKSAGTATKIDDGKKIEIPWTVTLTVPSGSLPSGTKISDDPTKDSSGAGEEHYMTYAQLKAWAENIQWQNDSGDNLGNVDLTTGNTVKFVDSNGDTRDYSDIIANDKSKNLTYKAWSITLGDDLALATGATKIVFKYSTTADVSNASIGSMWYKNTFTVNDKSASASYEYKKGGLIKTDENNETGTTTKYNEGELSWKIKATLASQSDKLTITDKLPAGVTLQSIKGTEYNANLTSITIDESGNISGTDGYYQVSGTYNKETNVVTLELTLVDAQKQYGNKLGAVNYGFQITCKVTDTSELTSVEEDGKTYYVFKNEASATDDSGKLGDAEQTQKWQEKKSEEKTKVIDKAGSWNNDDRMINYVITINPEGKDIVENSELLTLIDDLKYWTELTFRKYDASGNELENVTKTLSAELVVNSVKLYKAVKGDDGKLTKGEEYTGWSWTVEATGADASKYEDSRYHHSIITATNIPDSTPLILEYSYKFKADVDKDYVSDAMDISNTASIYGTDYSDGSSQKGTKWDKSSASGQVTTGNSYDLYKVSKGNFGKALAGAKFKLQKYDTSLATPDWVDTNDSYTSDTDGLIQIKWQEDEKDTHQYLHNVLYRLVETDAPTGYYLPEHPEQYAVYFCFKDETDTTYSLPTTIPTEAKDYVDLTSGSYQSFIENEAKETEITVNKKWLHYDGSVDNSKTGEISVSLYRKESTSQEGPDASNATVSGTVKMGNLDGSAWKTIDQSTHEIGSVLNLTFKVERKDGQTTDFSDDTNYKPTVEVNGSAVNAVSDSIDKSDGSRTIKYAITLKAGTTTIKGMIPQWTSSGYGYQWDCTYNYTEASATDDYKVGDYTIKSDEGWTKTIDNLPVKGTNNAGDTVFYYYYVVENTDVDGYTTSYDNNGGISSGTITVINKSDGSYTMPETGGSGTLPYEAAGSVAILGAMFYTGYTRRKRKGGIE